MTSAWVSAVREYFSRIELTAKLAPSCASAALVESLPIMPPRMASGSCAADALLAWFVP